MKHLYEGKKTLNEDTKKNCRVRKKIQRYEKNSKGVTKGMKKISKV